MKKFACIGTHSVGKSTLCYQLAEKHKRQGKSVHIIQERVRFSPFPINQSMKIETAIWACTNQMSKELEASTRGFDVIISDRSPFDPFVYSEHFNIMTPEAEILRKYAIEWMNSYDGVYFVRPDLDHVPLEDGVRSTDKEFIQHIDEIFECHIKHLKVPIMEILTCGVFK